MIETHRFVWTMHCSLKLFSSIKIRSNQFISEYSQLITYIHINYHIILNVSTSYIPTIIKMIENESQIFYCIIKLEYCYRNHPKSIFYDANHQFDILYQNNLHYYHSFTCRAVFSEL